MVALARGYVDLTIAAALVLAEGETVTTRARVAARVVDAAVLTAVPPSRALVHVCNTEHTGITQRGVSQSVPQRKGKTSCLTECATAKEKEKRFIYSRH